jgi:hypothetical protein
MRRLAALFSIVLALVATIPVADASAREPTPIKTCQTISQPGSYELANNLHATATATFDCLVITTSSVTIDLAGFDIEGGAFGNGISALPALGGIAVRNGSIGGFVNGVSLPIGPNVRGGENASIVEGLRITGFREGLGISAVGIVRNNVVNGNGTGAAGIAATGTVTGNYVSDTLTGIFAGAGSTVIGNTATNNFFFGISVVCPSNVTDNTSTGSQHNLALDGDGCNNTNNVAP